MVQLGIYIAKYKDIFDQATTNVWWPNGFQFNDEILLTISFQAFKLSDAVAKYFNVAPAEIGEKLLDIHSFSLILKP